MPSQSSEPARSSAGAGRKRSYLRRGERKQMLLDVAAGVVEAQGWTALSMSALATAAGVSRQLVYHYFPNLETLIAKTAWHIFNDTIEGTRASIAAHPDNLRDAAESAEAVTLDLPPGRGDALWQLIAGTAGATPELERIRHGIRQLISETWQPSMESELGLEGEDARAGSWMMVMAFWGMRQLVRDGELSRERGTAIFNTLLDRLTQAAES